MTKYHGGKQRIGLKIANAITDEVLDRIDDGFELKGYCEPFCGMLGVYQHIPELFEPLRSGCEPEGCEPEGCVEEGVDKLKYLAGDINESVIMMWQAVQNNWTPKQRIHDINEFNSLVGNGESSAEKGFVGHLYGYMGQYFRSYRKDVTLKRVTTTIEKIKNIAREIQNVKFSPGVYTQFSHLKGYIIYCDPPYQKQSNYYDEYNIRRKLDNDKFWKWVRLMSNNNNIMIVSEYKVPKDFTQLWTSSVNDEKLFTFY
jgi:site-specific DNA-adenine methylase